MKFLASEESKVGGLVGINVLSASVQPWTTHTETVLRIVLLLSQIAVAGVTTWWVYRKARGQVNGKE